MGGRPPALWWCRLWWADEGLRRTLGSTLRYLPRKVFRCSLNKNKKITENKKFTQTLVLLCRMVLYFNKPDLNSSLPGSCCPDESMFKHRNQEKMSRTHLKHEEQRGPGLMSYSHDIHTKHWLFPTGSFSCEKHSGRCLLSLADTHVESNEKLLRQVIPAGTSLNHAGQWEMVLGLENAASHKNTFSKTNFLSIWKKKKTTRSKALYTDVLQQLKSLSLKCGQEQDSWSQVG